MIEQFRTKTYVEQQNTYRTSDFQFKIAKWHYERLNFFAAYTNLSEAVVSRCAEFVLSYNGEQGALVDDFHFREAVKDYLKGVARRSEHDVLNEGVNAMQMIADLQDFVSRYPTLKQQQGATLCPAATYNVVMTNYTVRITN